MLTTNKYVLFWAGEFSNWHNSKMIYKGHKFANSEQAYMWEKAMFFNDTKTADLILNEPNPKENKKLGRQVEGFDAGDWLNACLKVMVEVNVAKYQQNEKLKWMLINTGDKTLAEASPYDKIWGIGLTEEEAAGMNEEDWPGMNLLGKALMEVRELLNCENN